MFFGLPVDAQTCYVSINELPSSCTGTITTDDPLYGGACRQIACSDGGGSIQVLACDKPSSTDRQYFEMYKQSSAGSPPRVCLGETCIQSEGYKRGGDYPICVDDSPPPSDDPGAESALTLGSGTINGQAVSPSDRDIIVGPGDAVTGSVTLSHSSAWPATISTPLIHTPTWGDHASSFTWTGNASGVGSKSVAVSEIAPTTPGEYWIVFAYRAEIDGGDVASMTNWAKDGTPNEVWNDGNDIASWTHMMISSANSDGRVLAPVLFDGGMQDQYVPATAVKVVVQELEGQGGANVTARILDHNVIPTCETPFIPEEFVWEFGDGTGEYVKNRSTLFHSDGWTEEEQEAFLDQAMAEPQWYQYHHMYRQNGTYTITCTARNSTHGEVSGSTVVSISTLATPEQLAAADEWNPFIFYDRTERLEGSTYRVGGYSLGLPHDESGEGQSGYWIWSLPFYWGGHSVHDNVFTITFPEPGNLRFFMDAGGWFYEEDPLWPRTGFDFFGCSNPRTICQGAGMSKNLTVPDLGTRDFFGISTRHVDNTTYEFRCENYASDAGLGGRIVVEFPGERPNYYEYAAGEWIRHTFNHTGNASAECWQSLGPLQKIYETGVEVINESGTLPPQSCTEIVNELPVNCTGTITSDDPIYGSCRKIICSQGSNSIQVLACPKDNNDYFEMYRQSYAGSPPKVCLGDACIQSTGFARGELPYCAEDTAPPPGPVCGNSIIESGETCDDGNTASGDGCSSTCQVETTGDPGASSTLDITGGTLAGQSISSNGDSITVGPGDSITGTLNLAISRAWASTLTVPLISTPTWGDHASSFRWHGNATQGSKDVSIDTTAPLGEGTYHIVLAYRAEIDGGDVASMTNWARDGDPNEVWGDGNDVAGWSTAMINTANANGRVQADVLFDSGYQQQYIPAAAITVIVGDTQACYDNLQQLPASCTGGTITTDESLYGGSCRKLVCESGGNRIQVLSCTKSDTTGQYFELYKQSASGSTPKLCLADTCIQSSGYSRGPYFPVCTGGGTTIGNSSGGNTAMTVSAYEPPGVPFSATDSEKRDAPADALTQPYGVGLDPYDLEHEMVRAQTTYEFPQPLSTDGKIHFAWQNLDTQMSGSPPPLTVPAGSSSMTVFATVGKKYYGQGEFDRPGNYNLSFRFEGDGLMVHRSALLTVTGTTPPECDTCDNTSSTTGATLFTDSTNTSVTADIIHFHETFPDDWPYGWRTLGGGMGSISVHSPGGAAQLAFSSSDGTSGYSALEQDLSIPVTNSTDLWYDVLVRQERLPDGCEPGCDAYPANVYLWIETDFGEVILRVRYSTLSRSDDEYKQVAPGQWQRGERLRIREAVPDATSIKKIRIETQGETAEGHYDNLYIVESSDAPAGSDIDLTVTGVSAPSWLMEGKQGVQREEMFNSTIRNDGTDTAPAGWSARYLLSRDTIPSADDLVLSDDTSTTSLAGNAERSDQTITGVPEGVPAGLYSLLVVVDPNDAVDETDESNNVGILQDVFVASTTLDPDYHPPENPDAAVTLQVNERYPFDHNYVFECVAQGFSPTQYNFTFSDGVQVARPVFDIYHTFPGSGNYTASCTATDGTNVASDDIAVEIVLPLEPEEFNEEFRPMPYNNSNAQFEGRWAVWLTAEEHDELWRISCQDIGFDDSAGMGWFDWPAELVVVSEDARRETRIVNVTTPGNYTVGCSAGMKEGYMWLYYYDFHPNIYHLDNGCCTGYGTQVFFDTTEPPVILPNSTDATVTVTIDPDTADFNHIFHCETDGMIPTQYQWLISDRDRNAVRSAMRIVNGTAQHKDDLLHTFLTGGDHTVMCTATNGTHQVSNTLLVEDIVPGSENPENFDHPALRSFVDVEKVSNMTYQFTCDPDGFRWLETPQIDWVVHHYIAAEDREETTLVESNQSQINWTFSAEGHAQVSCRTEAPVEYSHDFYEDIADPPYWRSVNPIISDPFAVG